MTRNIELSALLQRVSLEDLEPVLMEREFDLASVATLLEYAGGRPKVLALLKAAGVTNLSDRQALCGAISKALKAGELIGGECRNEDAVGMVLRRAASGDVMNVRAILQKGGVRSPRDSKGNTMLMLAIEGGHLDVVLLLLEHRVVDLDAQRLDGMTAVMLAIKGYHHHCLAALLDASADTNVLNRERWSALMLACQANNDDATRLLLAADANPSLGIHNGWHTVLTPLKLACIGGHASCVRLLLDARVGLDAEDGSGLDAMEADGSTMLIYATQRTANRIPQPGDGHVTTVRLLLAAQADPDQSRWDGITPLAYAAMHGDTEAAEMLLNAHANPSAMDEAGWTPLLWAARNGHTSCVSLLLDRRVAATESRPNGYTALHMAAVGGSKLCIEALLQSCGSSILDAATAINGRTGLMLASRHGHVECVHSFISAGAASSLVDAQGWTAIDHAIQAGSSKCLEALCLPDEARTPHADAVMRCAGSQELTSIRVEGGYCVFSALGDLSHLDHWQERTWQQPSGRCEANALKYCISSGHPHFANLLQCILLEHGFQRAHSGMEWSLKWVAGQVDPATLCQLLPYQTINKFPSASCLTTKSELWRIFARMQRKHGEHAYNFVPSSFVLPEQANELRTTMADQATSPNSVWIIKPVAGCRGQGISLRRSADGLPSDIASCSAVASRYVHPPYLISGRKLDLRLYVLVTSWRPLVIYLHREGLLRLASEPYTMSDLSNPRVHLTNYAVNKASAVHADGRPRLDSEQPLQPKMGLDDFDRQLVSDVGEVRAQAVWLAVDEVIVKTLLAAEPTMGQAAATYVPSYNRCFQLFGFDVMFDFELQPYVLEVSLDPSLATDTPLDLRVKGAVITDLLNLVGVSYPCASSNEARRADTAMAGRLSGGEDQAANSELWMVNMIDAELSRAQRGGWRRLHPCGSNNYSAFIEPSRVQMNTLGFATPTT